MTGKVRKSSWLKTVVIFVIGYIAGTFMPFSKVKEEVSKMTGKK